MRWTEIPYRLKQFFVPLFLLTITFTSGYSVLAWLLIYRNNIIPIDDEVSGGWLPILGAFVFVAIFVNPRIRNLKLTWKKNLRFLYYMIAVAIVLAPTLTAQYYIRNASGTLTHVTDAAQIRSLPETKYYSANSTCLMRDRAVSRPVSLFEGRRNDSLNFYLYVLVPICGDISNLSTDDIWVGFVFHKIAASSTNSERQAEFESFLRASEQAFNSENTSNISYFERLGNNFDSRNFEKLLSQTEALTSENRTVLIAHTEPFEQRTGNSLPWVFKSFAIGMLAWLALILIPPIEHESKRILKDALRERDGWNIFSKLFLIPSRQNYGLPILIDLNVAVFLIMAFAGVGVASIDANDLRTWGANYGPDLHGIGMLRMLTSQFVHAGFLHIFNNMYALGIVGFFLLPILRNAKLICCYLLSGLGGNVASLFIHPTVISVGASGAIMGLWGILLAVVLLKDQRLVNETRLIMINGVIVVGLTLFLGAVTPAIDNAAHIGGLLTGLGLGALVARFKIGEPQIPVRNRSS